MLHIKLFKNFDGNEELMSIMLLLLQLVGNGMNIYGLKLIMLILVEIKSKNFIQQICTTVINI